MKGAVHEVIRLRYPHFIAGLLEIPSGRCSQICDHISWPGVCTRSGRHLGREWLGRPAAPIERPPRHAVSKPLKPCARMPGESPDLLSRNVQAKLISCPKLLNACSTGHVQPEHRVVLDVFLNYEGAGFEHENSVAAGVVVCEQ